MWPKSNSLISKAAGATPLLSRRQARLFSGKCTCPRMFRKMGRSAHSKHRHSARECFLPSRRQLRLGDRLVQILLKSHEYLADLFGLAEVGDGVGNGVEILQTEQWR